MEVLYQLSYVGANTNPSVVAADLDMIPARNDHKCSVGSGGVFVAVPGTFQGQNAREASPAPSRRALRTQSGRDLTDTEAPMPINGKDEVSGSIPDVGSAFVPQRRPQAGVGFARSCRLLSAPGQRRNPPKGAENGAPGVIVGESSLVDGLGLRV
jgi:hypothetical protein